MKIIIITCPTLPECFSQFPPLDTVDATFPNLSRAMAPTVSLTSELIDSSAFCIFSMYFLYTFRFRSDQRINSCTDIAKTYWLQNINLPETIKFSSHVGIPLDSAHDLAPKPERHLLRSNKNKNIGFSRTFNVMYY